MEHHATKPPLVFALVHGILTPRENWTDWSAVDLKCRFGHDCIVLQQEYHAGPLPLFNRYIVNPKVAADLADDLQKLRCQHPCGRFFIIAHSNGADIALKALNLLPDAEIEAVVLMAGAVHADVGRNGLRRAYERRAVERAICWHSKGDHVIGWWARLSGLLTFGFGYGRLGEIGFQGKRKGEPFTNYRDPHPDHSDNWSARYIKETLNTLLDQLSVRTEKKP